MIISDWPFPVIEKYGFSEVAFYRKVMGFGQWCDLETVLKIYAVVLVVLVHEMHWTHGHWTHWAASKYTLNLAPSQKFLVESLKFYLQRSWIFLLLAVDGYISYSLFHILVGLQEKLHTLVWLWILHVWGHSILFSNPVTTASYR